MYVRYRKLHIVLMALLTKTLHSTVYSRTPQIYPSEWLELTVNRIERTDMAALRCEEVWEPWLLSETKIIRDVGTMLFIRTIWEMRKSALSMGYKIHFTEIIMNASNQLEKIALKHAARSTEAIAERDAAMFGPDRSHRRDREGDIFVRNRKGYRSATAHYLIIICASAISIRPNFSGDFSGVCVDLKHRAPN